MALFHVSHPLWLRLVGVRTSYIHFSNISWTPRALDPITNPFLGPSSWLHPASVGLAQVGDAGVSMAALVSAESQELQVPLPTTASSEVGSRSHHHRF